MVRGNEVHMKWSDLRTYESGFRRTMTLTSTTRGVSVTRHKLALTTASAQWAMRQTAAGLANR